MQVDKLLHIGKENKKTSINASLLKITNLKDK